MISWQRTKYCYKLSAVSCCSFSVFILFVVILSSLSVLYPLPRAVIFIILLLLFCDSLQSPHYIPVYRFVCPFFFCDAGQSHRLSLVGYLAIVLGALLWWFGITYFVNKVRTRFNLRGIWILNRVIGIVVMLISVAGFIYTILGKTMY